MHIAIAALVAMLILTGVMSAAGQGVTNNAALLVPLRPLTDADRSFISAVRSHKPLSVMSITNRLSQNDILSLCDPVSVYQGMNRYLDAMCGFGARLHRDYVGPDSVCSVSFLWDGFPKVTQFSFYSTNAILAASWHVEMLEALRTNLGSQNVRVLVQPINAPNERR